MRFQEIVESQHKCPHCGGPVVEYSELMEKKDACYYKVKASAKVWPSAYASGRLVQCRKKGAANYGNKSESVAEAQLDEKCWDTHKQVGMKNKGGRQVPDCRPKESQGVAEGLNEFAPPERGDGQENRFNFQEEFESDDGEYLIELYRNVQSRSFAVSFHRNNMQYVMYPIDGIDAGDLSDGAARYVQEIKKNAAHGSQEDFVAMGSMDLEDFIPPEQGVAEDLSEEFDLIENIIEGIAEHNGVDAETVWADLESLTEDELYAFAVTSQLNEDWQKANKKDKTDGMSQKAVNAYRRENPGSKLKTAVTTKPSKLKKGGKASKRRKSYCSRSRGQMKMHSISCAKTPDKAICKARRRWNC